MTILSDYSYELYVMFLNAIEQGKITWPADMLQTRTVFLSKDPDDTANPLAYGGFKNTSAWYRCWASCRLKALDKWISQWDHPALHVVGGKGAQDVWLKTNLKAEIALLEHKMITGGSFDIYMYKCFDQINRDLVYRLAAIAGMPERS